MWGAKMPVQRTIVLEYEGAVKAAGEASACGFLISAIP
jgi:hypothetical protein